MVGTKKIEKDAKAKKKDTKKEEEEDDSCPFC